MGYSEKESSIAKVGVSKLPYILLHVCFIIVCAACIYPFLVILGSSFQEERDILINGYALFPKVISLTAYKMILRDPSILLNSYFITILTTVVGTLASLWITSSFAYVLSRRNFKYRNYLSFYIFFTMLFSGGLVPSYIMIAKWLGMKNTIWALIIPGIIGGWNVLLMKGFLQTIPEAIIESAKIDGAGEVYIFARIILPISKPALATVGLFMVLHYWNDWFSTLLYIDTQRLMKLQYMLIRVLKNMEFLNSAEAIQYGVIMPGMEIPTQGARMAMCVLAAGPMLLVFPFFQKYFVRGITVGSIKG
jgi:putative aldouronate transport system permease protein